MDLIFGLFKFGIIGVIMMVVGMFVFESCFIVLNFLVGVVVCGFIVCVNWVLSVVIEILICVRFFLVKFVRILIFCVIKCDFVIIVIG